MSPVTRGSPDPVGSGDSDSLGDALGGALVGGAEVDGVGAAPSSPPSEQPASTRPARANAQATVRVERARIMRNLAVSWPTWRTGSAGTGSV